MSNDIQQPNQSPNEREMPAPTYPVTPFTPQPGVPSYPPMDMTRPMFPSQPMMPTQPMMPMMPMQPMMPMMPGNGGSGMFPGMQQDFSSREGPPTLTDIGYTPAFMRTQIGRTVKIEFLIGTNVLVDRMGTLVDVGINYVLIREIDSDDLLLCDLYSIKFVKFYY